MSEQSIDGEGTVSKSEIRTTGLSVTPPGECIYSDRSWRVEIDTEGAGEYVVVHGRDDGEIKIDPDEWLVLFKAIDQLVRECKEDR